jgi:hypothetical protein
LRVGRPVDTTNDRCIQFAPLSSRLASPTNSRSAIGWTLHFDACRPLCLRGRPKIEGYELSPLRTRR